MILKALALNVNEMGSFERVLSRGKTGTHVSTKSVWLFVKSTLKWRDWTNRDQLEKIHTREDCNLN